MQFIWVFQPFVWIENPPKMDFTMKSPEIAVISDPKIASYTPASSVLNNLSIASLTSSKLAGLGMSVSMQL